MAENQSSMELEEITPEERRWRMSQVYELLSAVAREKRMKQQRPEGLTGLQGDNVADPRG